MSVSRETILAALEDMIQLEELSTSNLTEVDRYDLSCFGPEGEGKIRELLMGLREDFGAHERLIWTLMEMLRNDAKNG
jgi:hypothetical protein